MTPNPASAEQSESTESIAPAKSNAWRALEYVSPFRIGLVGALGVLAAIAIGGIVGALSTVLIYIGVALFLALGLDPIVSRLERRLSRTAAIGVVVVVVVLAFVAALFAIIPVLVEQISNIVRNGPQMIDDFLASDWFHDIDQMFGPVFQDVVDAVTSYLQDGGNIALITGGIFAVGAGFANGLTGLTIVLILTLYFLASLRHIKSLAARFAPAYRRERFSELLEDVSGAVGRYIVGQVGLAAINGILSFVFLSIIGAPAPALLALIAFIGSTIPLVGTLSASIIISVVCLLASPPTALAAAIYYVIYMQVESYFLSPRIMSKAVAVPGALVVIAAVAGGALGGVLGALVAIPVAASAIIIVQKVVFPAQDRKDVDPRSV